MLHRHQGTELGRRWVPGVMDLGGNVKGSVADEVVYGYTEITYKCECGKYWNRRVIGKINERQSKRDPWLINER